MIGRSLSRHMGMSRLYVSAAQTPIVAATGSSGTPKPKSYPKSAYNVFQQDPKVREGLQHIKSGGVAAYAKEFSKIWANLSEKEKAKYKAEQVRLQQEYEAVHGKARKTKTTSDPKPPTPYNKFVKANYDEARKEIGDTSQVFKVLGQKWKGLSATEKKKYG